jgi:dihydrofolate reductase
MRKLNLKMSLSVDGFVGAPDGDVAWLFDSIDDESSAWLVDTLWNAGVHIMGSRTFEGMAAHWPTSEEPFAPPMNDIAKIVFSRDRDFVRNVSRAVPASPRSKSWTDARVATGDLAEEILKLKQEGGKDILAHGGAAFVQSLKTVC